MAYKHILVAVDLSPESQLLVNKAVLMARPYHAKLSLLHVEPRYTDLYNGLIDAHMGYTPERVSEENYQTLKELAHSADYPVSEILNSNGDLAQVLEETIIKYGIDMVVCGHHQDFWSRLLSSARQLLNKVHTDILIVPLRDGSKSK